MMYSNVQGSGLLLRDVKSSFYHHVFISQKSYFFFQFLKHKLNSLVYILNNLKILNNCFNNETP